MSRAGSTGSRHRQVVQIPALPLPSWRNTPTHPNLRPLVCTTRVTTDQPYRAAATRGVKCAQCCPREAQGHVLLCYEAFCFFLVVNGYFCQEFLVSFAIRLRVFE